MSEGENDDGMFGFTNYSETKQIRHEINRHIFLFNEKYPLHPSPPPEELQLKFTKSNRQMFLLFGNYQRKSLFQDKLNLSMTWKKERKGLVCFLDRWRKCKQHAYPHPQKQPWRKQQLKSDCFAAWEKVCCVKWGTFRTRNYMQIKKKKEATSEQQQKRILLLKKNYASRII